MGIIDLDKRNAIIFFNFFCLAIISFQKRMKCQTIESKKTVNISLKHLRVIQAYGSCPQTLPTMGIQAY